MQKAPRQLIYTCQRVVVVILLNKSSMQQILMGIISFAEVKNSVSSSSAAEKEDVKVINDSLLYLLLSSLRVFP